MPRFRVLQGTGLAAFVIADETGRVEPQSERFLTALGLRDLSPYTILAYARGLAHFHGWCVEHGVRLAEVTPTTVQAYIEAFRWPGEGERAAATTNHRLSVLASYFDHLIAAGSGAPEWRDKANPVRPAQRLERTVPMRRRAGRVRADLRRRLPRRVPVHLSPEEIEAVYGAATSWRDRALLRLLEWSGQRVGDWDAVHGRHGLLGLRVGDVDCVARTVTVRLKGARDDHVVPVGEAFWPDYRAYLERERGAPEHPAVWIARRKGGGRPLGYPTFETMIRVLRRRSGVSRLSAHAYRHTFAQNLLDTSDNLALVQAFLGHAHLDTTAAHYARIPMARLMAAVRELEEQQRRPRPAASGNGYAFAYDRDTRMELERLFAGDGDG
jgi:site-specific recombinase XerD